MDTTTLLLAIIAIALAIIFMRHRRGTAPTARSYRRRPAQFRPSLPNATPSSNSRRKPDWVLDALIAIVAQTPEISCRNLKLRFDLVHAGSGVSIGKTYAAKFLQQYRHVLANPKRHVHSIDTAGRLLRV